MEEEKAAEREIAQVAKAEESKNMHLITIQDVPLLARHPAIFGATPEAQEAGFNQLKKLVSSKNRDGFYDKFAKDGQTLTFLDKLKLEAGFVYQESIGSQSAEYVSTTTALNEPTMALDEPTIRIGDLPVLRKRPELLGGVTTAAQKAGMRQLEELVKFKDSQGFYDQFSRDGITLTFFDKVYIESTILEDTANA